MSDWDASDNESAPAAPARPPVPKKVPVKSKWEGEDEEESEPASDWEESSSEEEEKKPPASTTTAPPKKKGTLKQKLAEKEAAKKAKGDDDIYDEDEVLDPREKARRDKERELNADLANAADLLGAAALGGTSSKELDALLTFNPRTKEDFLDFSHRVFELLIKRLQDRPLYSSFVEHHVREIAGPLKDVEVRKAASALTTLANEKQKEQRDKASGKKKKAAAKPTLGSAKVVSKLDTSAYDEGMDDFGADDFM
ncbi:translation initiation factor eIF3 subunit [Gloeophyllum trabeum ATCC 11539]|uniref:Eukaryotic translation initiation factor 3 subunit J n=1 Tax=Gloeophyllum trabeum (strain ATCC 11539 / FP-39264 / Madison 617) TaxID=670483 RepID=S7PZ80_GLOTA|nr:translation initiation factor eIF3 subunit [Gloeophyllum trabeum ATCC 11539]EPQ52597.1 translation initiation factor eIF3 subunit [Gloeophyllum trabeum ATCC 11539]